MQRLRSPFRLRPGPGADRKGKGRRGPSEESGDPRVTGADGAQEPTAVPLAGEENAGRESAGGLPPEGGNPAAK